MTMVFKMFTLGLSWSQSNTECQAFCPVVRLGSPPCKLRPLQANVSPPLNPKGGSNTRLRFRGWGYHYPLQTTGTLYTLWSWCLVWRGNDDFRCRKAFEDFDLDGDGAISTAVSSQILFWITENFYFLSDEILTVLFLRSCNMPSEERKFYYTFRIIYKK